MNSSSTLRFVILGGLLLLTGCGVPMRWGGWTPSPYPEEACLAHGCRWNRDKAQCECGALLGIQPTPMP